MKGNKDQVQLLIKFLDSCIGEPKQRELEQALYKIQQFYHVSNLLGLSAQLSNDIFFRYAKLCLGRKSGKIAVHKCMEEAFRFGKSDIVAECEVLLVALTEKGEENDAKKLAEQAEKQIVATYGKMSKEFAELSSARTKYLALQEQYK